MLSRAIYLASKTTGDPLEELGDGGLGLLLAERPVDGRSGDIVWVSDEGGVRLLTDAAVSAETVADWARLAEDDVERYAELQTAAFGSGGASGERLQAATSVAHLRALAPHLRKMVDVRARIADTERKALMLERTLDDWATAVLHLTPAGEVLFANAAAETLLQAGNGLRRTGGRLRCGTSAETSRLSAAVGRAVTEGKGDAFSLRRGGEHDGLPCTVLPLPSSAGGSAAALVIIADVEAREPDQSWKWAAVFGLTPAEAELVERLREGLSLQEIADARRVSLSTVKTQLQRVFEKTEVSRQSALVAKLGRIPATRRA